MKRSLVSCTEAFSLIASSTVATKLKVQPKRALNGLEGPSSGQSISNPPIGNEGAHLGGGVQAYWHNTGAVPAEPFFGVVELLSEVVGVKTQGVLVRASGE